MRIRASTLLKWAATVAAVYVVVLGLWRVFEPFYMHALGAFVSIASAARLVPASAEAVAVAGRGLAIAGAGLEPIAVPQRIIGADVALAVALISATLWLRWPQRARHLPSALVLVFTAHLATVLAQIWVVNAGSSGAWAAWNLWTTLYQGKVVPLAVWCAVMGPVLLRSRAWTAGPQQLDASWR